MGLFSALFGGNFQSFKAKGDKHRQSGQPGLAKGEYETALDRFAEGKDDPQDRLAVEKALQEVKQALAEEHLAKGEELLQLNLLEDAEDYLALVLDLCADGELRDRAWAAMERLEESLAQEDAQGGANNGGKDGLPGEEEGHHIEGEEVEEDDPFEVHLMSLPGRQADHYRRLGETFARGYVKLQEGDGEGAIESLEEAMKESASPYMHLELGRARLFVGDADQAQEHLAQFRQDHPKHMDASFLHAEALRATGRSEEALGVLLEAVKHRPDSARVQMEIATHHLADGAWDEAVSAASAAMAKCAKEPAKAAAEEKVGADGVGQDQGEEESEEEERTPPRIAILRTLGKAHLGAGRTGEAAEVLEAAMKEYWRYDCDSGSLEFDRESAWLLAALYIQTQKRPNRAADLLHALEHAAPPEERPVILTQLGVVYGLKGEASQARQFLMQARSLTDPNNSEALELLEQKLTELRA